MKREIEIGRASDGRPVTMDVDVMLRSGLLVQANSGGGKSWLLRRLAEQLCPIVPTFVVDVEGEFSSLREKFPFFLVAKSGGDATADPARAAALARKLLELRVSAVFDLFELDIPDRQSWARAFLESMDKAPRELWGDTAFVIDEAHVFAPERGKGESVALAGMSAMASRGRKRGYGPIDATQRMGKFNKDVAAELKNAAIGWTWMDIDRDRAIETLGVGRKDREAFDKQLRHMHPGEFFVIGRAFGTIEPVKVKIGPVESTHPEPGASKQMAAPPPPAKIRAILAKLGDLPKEAPSPDGGGDGAARARVAELEREISELKAAPPKVEYVTPLAFHNSLVKARALVALLEAGFSEADANGVKLEIPEPRVPVPPGVKVTLVERTARQSGTTDGQLDKTARETEAGDGAARMLRALAARHPTPLTDQQLATLAVMKRKGGSFRTYRSRLTTAGLIRVSGGFNYITDDGLKKAGPTPRPMSGSEMLTMWLAKPKFSGGAGRLLKLFADGGVYTKADACARAGIKSTGGSARTYWSRLTSCGLLERTPGGFRAVESLRVA